MTAVAFPSRVARIEALLRDSALSDLRELQVQEIDQQIVILGEVSSYYLKQMAQELVRPALGGRHLCNRIRVCAASI